MAKKKKEVIKKINEKENLAKVESNVRGKLFSVVPVLVTTEEADAGNYENTFIKFNESNYRSLFNRALDVATTPLDIDKTTLELVKSHLDYSDKTLEILNNIKSESPSKNIDAFISEIERRLTRASNRFALDTILEDIKTLTFDARIQCYSDIRSIFYKAIDNIDEKCDDAFLVQAKCYNLIELINLVAKNEALSNSYNMNYQYNNKVYNDIMNISGNNTYRSRRFNKNTDEEKFKSLLDDVVYTIDASRFASIETKTMYTNIYKLVASVYGYDVIPEMGCSMTQAIMATLDGFHVFHIFHEKLVSIYEYLMDVVKAYKDIGIFNNRSTDSDIDDDDWY